MKTKKRVKSPITAPANAVITDSLFCAVNFEKESLVPICEAVKELAQSNRMAAEALRVIVTGSSVHMNAPMVSIGSTARDVKLKP